jgi:AcrR family transcriptional regulator
MDAPDANSSAAPRRRILQVALELMAEHGYEGMSLQQVADGVGLHKSSLFHHFRSKEELAREVYQGVAERLLKRVEPVLAEDPPRFESLLLALDASVDLFAAEPAAARLLMRLMVTSRGEQSGPFHAPAGSHDPIGQLLTGIGRWLARARQAGVIRHVPVRHSVLNLMGLVLFYPGVAHHIPQELLGADPRSAEMVESRKRELRTLLSGAFAPR